MALLGLAFGSKALRPIAPVSNVRDLPPDALRQPTEVERALTVLMSFENLFWVLAAVLAVVLARYLGRWEETGFNRPSRWRDLGLLLPPLLVGALALSGGFRLGSAPFLAATLFGVLVVAFAEEALYRGVAWRVLSPTGLLRAAVVTALLSGVLRFGGMLLSGPWPEATQASLLAICGGLTYAALRWRTGSIWPVILLHSALGCAYALYSPGALLFLAVLLLGTFGFALYGLFLLRKPQTHVDGDSAA
jgi:membrane protease YdiL (CAAX protease family)